MTESVSVWIRVEKEGRDYKGHKETFFHYLVVVTVTQVHTFAKT